MGWFGEPKAKTKKDLLDIVAGSYKDNLISKTQIKDDHFWILYKNKGIVSATCYLINDDGTELSYKPIGIEEGPRNYDVPKSWINQITDVEERNCIKNKHLKYWLNNARKHHNMKIKPYEFDELNYYSEYKGKIYQMDHLIATDPHYGPDVWCRYEKKFDNPVNWNVSLVVSTQDHFEEYKDYTLNIGGVDFTLLLTNTNYEDIDKVLRLKENKGIIYLKSFNVDNTQLGMDTAQMSLGVNSYAKEIADYYKDYDNDSLDLDGYRPYFSIETLTDGLFGDVREYKVDNKVVGIAITGWIDDDADYDENRIVDYLANRMQIDNLEKVYDSLEDLKEKRGGQDYENVC